MSEKHHEATGEKKETPPKIVPIPADPVGPLPRVVKPEERAIDGTTRFKISCRNYTDAGPLPTLYILAKSVKDERVEKGKEGEDPTHGAKAEDDCRKCYLKHVGIDKKMEQIQKNRVASLKAMGKGQKEIDFLDPLDAPDLSVTTLKD